MTEAEITKLLAKAKLSIEKQERYPESERSYQYRYRDSEPFKQGRIEYDFILPNRLDDANVSRDLYRIRFADGSLSDLGNLTRIKDAAIAHARALLGEDS